MRKEVLFAILAGAVFGLVIAFGVWRANTALKTNKEEVSTTNSTQSQTPEPEVAEKSGLTLAKPENLDVISESPVAVSGITSPNSWIVISGESNDYIMQTNNSGAFEENVELEVGVNQILIWAYDENGVLIENKLTLVFSTEFTAVSQETEEKEVDDSTDSAQTKDADAVREKVQEKINLARNKPKAYIGTVTDILEGTVQIKGSTGEIQQVSISEEETDFVSVGKKTTTVGFEDLAIGDFIIAMGFKNGNSVLEATRVLIASPLTEPDRKIIKGEITEIGKKEITVSSSSEDALTLGFGKRWKGPEISELNEGDTVIAILTTEDEDLIVRTIQVITQKPEEETPVSTTSAEENRE